MIHPYLHKNRVGNVVLICMLIFSIGACSDNKSYPPKEGGEVRTHNWQRIIVGAEHKTYGDDGYVVSESGLMLPHLVARLADNGQLHIAHYNAVKAENDEFYQQLNYLIYNSINGRTTIRVVENRPAPSGANGFDRANQFDLALDGSTPVFIYPTYEFDTRLQYVEADIVVNLYESGSWHEATGAVGFVPRNPEYRDGHVKDSMSVVVDSQGNIHMAYQYFTEGMDSANYRYPDIYYTYRERATLADPITDIAAYGDIEERVDGNVFSSYGNHNSVGFHCKLLLDPEEMPVIVYAEHAETFAGTFALKVAFRNAAGQWRIETVEDLADGWTVGGISAAFYPPPVPDPNVPVDPEAPEPDRPLAIAYALRSPTPEDTSKDNAHHLKFAVQHQRQGKWTTQIVDETTWCGTHCSLAFTPDGYPAIAYYDEESYSRRTHKYLKYAEFNGLMWELETADEEGSVGQYNSLWFDAGGMPTICTYSDRDNQILLIRQINGS